MECRICRGGEEEEALWKPCDCMYQGVHISCLERWLETRSGAYANQLTCEVWPRTGSGRLLNPRFFLQTTGLPGGLRGVLPGAAGVTRG